MYLFYVIQDKGRCLLLSIGIAKEAERDIAENGTISHNAINWD